jgi:flagellar basal body-associated protein FliL
MTAITSNLKGACGMSESDQEMDTKQTPDTPSRKMMGLAAAIIAVVLVACGIGVYRYISKESDANNNAKTAAAKAADRPYTLTAPKDWERIVPTPEGATVAFADQIVDSDATGKLKAFIAVQSTGLNSAAQKMTFDSISQSYISQLSQSYTDFTLVNSSQKTINGLPAVLVTFTFTQSNAAVTASSLFTVKKGISYAVNGEALTSTWADHSAEIEAALLTFRP